MDMKEIENQWEDITESKIKERSLVMEMEDGPTERSLHPLRVWQRAG